MVSRNEVVRRRIAKQTFKEIGEALGISSSRVQQIFKRYKDMDDPDSYVYVKPLRVKEIRPPFVSTKSKIVEEMKLGKTPEEIASKFGTTPEYVRQIFKANGVTYIIAEKPRSPSVSKIMSLYEKGKTPEEIQSITGQNIGHIRTTIKKNGGTFTLPRETVSRKAVIMRLAGEGKSRGEIAVETGYDFDYVMQVFRLANLSDTHLPKWFHVQEYEKLKNKS